MFFTKIQHSFLIQLQIALFTFQFASAEVALLVPSYIYPSGDGATQWAALAAAAETADLTAILNPNSGPGTAQDANYVAAVGQVRAVGGSVLGYVSSSYTNRALSAVFQDIATYVSLYSIDGFFIDEMTNDDAAAHIQYYQSVYEHIQNISADYQVVANPGTNIPEAYLNGDTPCADQFVVFENSVSQYAAYSPLAYQTNYSLEQFAHILYGVTNSSQMAEIVQGANAKGAGAVYVTDQQLPNPYGALPAYWSAEVEQAQEATDEA